MALYLPSGENTGMVLLVFIGWNQECVYLTNSASTYKRYVSLLTYLLTPWSRVLLEKLTGSAASQEIPRIFVTPRFLTVPTSARHLSLS